MVEHSMNVLEYFKGDELAASTWQNKYAAKGEVTPDDTHRRLAKEFARIEEKYNWQLKPENKLKLSNYGYNRPQLTEDSIFKLFKDFKYVIPGGSVMAGCGTRELVSLSNCFVIDSPKDSYAEIMKTRSQQAQLMKRRGGVGYDLSKLRPRGAKVNNAAKSSTGAASFMDVCSDITNEVAQNGRRGALMLSMSINHPDIEEFITKKQDLTKVTGANISVKVTDEFMRAVENDEDYILTFPVDSRLIPEDVQGFTEYNKLYHSPYDSTLFKRVKAKELWNTLMHCAWNTAEPGIMFEDAMHNSPDGSYDNFKMVSTNPCQPSWATVLTPDGIRTFADINIGDTIWSSEGWTKVINKWSTGIKPVYKYRTSGGVFYGTENHKVVSKGVKIEAKDCESIDSLTAEFEPYEGDLDPQLIMDGLVLGDGYVHKASNNLIVLCIGENDGLYFESEIKDLIGKYRPGIGETSYEVKTTIKPEELRRKYEIAIPKRFMNLDKKSICALLRGLYSANGSVVNNRITYKTSSPILRDQIQLLLSYIGIDSYYTTNSSHTVAFSNGDFLCKESYDINISSDRDKFYNYIGFIQKYKMDKIDISKTSKTRNYNRSIIEVKYISTEEVFDITVDNSSHTYWTGGLNVSNCGEIPMGPFDSCRLIHLNLSSFIDNPFTDKATIDEEKLYEVSYEAMRLADDLVDLEIEAVDRIIKVVEKDKDFTEFNLWSRIRETAIKGRRAGLGFTGLADAIAMLGLKYDSDKGLSEVEHIMRIMFKAQLDCQVDMAIERGSFPAWDREKELSAITIPNSWYKWLSDNYTREHINMTVHGRRNISWSTVAPTGTVSIMAQCSSGIEPVFLPFYERKRKCMSPEDRVDYTDIKGEKYTLFMVLHPNFEKWYQSQADKEWFDESIASSLSLCKPEVISDIFKKSPYYGSTAPEIDWHQRVKLQGIVQKYITHSISSTVNLPKETTEEEIANIYIEAWKAGNKGQTIYRDGCREGVLNKVEKSKVIDNRQAPKRPKELEADYYQIKVKGEQFIVLVGLLEGKPYEIFAFRPLRPVSIPTHKGKIIKVSKMHYSFDSEYIQLSDLQLANTNVEEKAATLYASMLLRHGANIEYITKTAKKVNDNITSFSSAMCRILAKYITNTEVKEVCPECGADLVHEGGCIHCQSCSYSRCE